MVRNLIIESVTNEDGKLLLGEIDTGLPATPVRVQLTIDPSPAPKMSEEELARWESFVERTEGRIDDPSFHRQPHGIYEPVPSFDEDE